VAGLGQVGRNRPSNQFVRAINSSEQSVSPSNQLVRAIGQSGDRAINQAECCPSCLQMPEAEAQLASKDRKSVQVWHWASSKINGPWCQASETTNVGGNRAAAKKL